jgi:hypothetical protein
MIILTQTSSLFLEATLPHYQQISAIIEGITQRGVNFIAIDFDYTLIDLHTLGDWRDGPRRLTPHVRPMFQTLMTLALRRGSLSTAMNLYS